MTWCRSFSGRGGNGERFGNLLGNPLMGATMIEEGDLLTDHPSDMTLAKDQDMVQAFAPNSAEEPLT